jgi:antitoxin MazE
MQAKVSKWGHSLAIRIPAHIANEAELAEGTIVDVKTVDGCLVVRATETDAIPTLEEMLASVTPGHTHGEVDWGRPVGNEVW